MKTVVMHEWVVLLIGAYFITEDFDLAVSPMHDWTIGVTELVISVDLKMQWKTFYSFLTAEIRTQALDGDINLKRKKS